MGSPAAFLFLALFFGVSLGTVDAQSQLRVRFQLFGCDDDLNNARQSFRYDAASGTLLMGASGLCVYAQPNWILGLAPCEPASALFQFDISPQGGVAAPIRLRSCPYEDGACYCFSYPEEEDLAPVGLSPCAEGANGTTASATFALLPSGQLYANGSSSLGPFASSGAFAGGALCLDSGSLSYDAIVALINLALCAFTLLLLAPFVFLYQCRKVCVRWCRCLPRQCRLPVPLLAKDVGGANGVLNAFFMALLLRVVWWSIEFNRDIFNADVSCSGNSPTCRVGVLRNFLTRTAHVVFFYACAKAMRHLTFATHCKVLGHLPFLVPPQEPNSRDVTSVLAAASGKQDGDHHGAGAASSPVASSSARIVAFQMLLGDAVAKIPIAPFDIAHLAMDTWMIVLQSLFTIVPFFSDLDAGALDFVKQAFNLQVAALSLLLGGLYLLGAAPFVSATRIWMRHAGSVVTCRCCLCNAIGARCGDLCDRPSSRRRRLHGAESSYSASQSASPTASAELPLVSPSHSNASSAASAGAAEGDGHHKHSAMFGVLPREEYATHGLKELRNKDRDVEGRPREDSFSHDTLTGEDGSLDGGDEDDDDEEAEQMLSRDAAKDEVRAMAKQSLLLRSSSTAQLPTVQTPLLLGSGAAKRASSGELNAPAATAGQQAATAAVAAAMPPKSKGPTRTLVVRQAATALQYQDHHHHRQHQPNSPLPPPKTIFRPTFYAELFITSAVLALIFFLRAAVFFYEPLAGKTTSGWVSVVTYPWFVYTGPEALVPLVVLNLLLPGGGAGLIVSIASAFCSFFCGCCCSGRRTP